MDPGPQHSRRGPSLKGYASEEEEEEKEEEEECILSRQAS